MTLDEKWKDDLEIRLNKEKQELEIRVAAAELAVQVMAAEVDRISRESLGRMGMALTGGLRTSGGVLAPLITAQARKLLGL